MIDAVVFQPDGGRKCFITKLKCQNIYATAILTFTIFATVNASADAAIIIVTHVLTGRAVKTPILVPALTNHCTTQQQVST